MSSRSYKEEKVGSREFLSVAGEFRNTLKAIKEEVEILGIGDSSAIDIFTSFAQLLQKEENLPEFVRTSMKQEEVEN